MTIAKYKVLCFGDSNTWGYIPSGDNPDDRYPRNIRWTGVLQELLGPQFLIVEEGLNSRTTAVEDPDLPGKNGLSALPEILKTHSPINLFILMLGINDLKRKFKRTPEAIAKGIEDLVDSVKSFSQSTDSKTRILILSPPIPQLKYIYEPYQYKELEDKARRLAPLYEKIASQEAETFLDLTNLIHSSKVDGAHLDGDEHRKLAELLVPIVLGMAGKIVL